MMSKFFVVLMIIFIFSCSSNKLEDLGLLKKKANEYSISRKAPLAMPPDMYLSPPNEKEDNIIVRDNNNKNNDGLTLDDILLGKEQNEVKKNKNFKNKNLKNNDRIINRILRTKAIIVIN